MFAKLTDEALLEAIRRQVAAAGGSVAELRIGPRPPAELPVSMPGRPDRLWRYSDGVKRTVATRMRKEALGWAMVVAHEARVNAQYTWVMWTREDSHWFASLRVDEFSLAEVHGKACGGFGGWNDKVSLREGGG